jgi:N-acetylneuraminate synthase
MRGERDLSISPGEHEARRQFRRSIVAARDLEAGTVLKEDMLVLKRPGTGLHPHRLSDLLGRRLRTGLKANDQIIPTQLDPPLEEEKL